MNLFRIVARIFSYMDVKDSHALALAFQSMINERLLSRSLDLSNSKYAIPTKLLDHNQPSRFDWLKLEQNWIECKHKIEHFDVRLPIRRKVHYIIATLNKHYVTV